MVERELPKLLMRVRFSLPAPNFQSAHTYEKRTRSSEFALLAWDKDKKVIIKLARLLRC